MEDEDVTLGIDGGDVIQLDDEDYYDFMDLIDEEDMTHEQVINHIFNVMFNAEEVMKNMEMLNGMLKGKMLLNGLKIFTLGLKTHLGFIMYIVFWVG